MLIRAIKSHSLVCDRLVQHICFTLSQHMKRVKKELLHMKIPSPSFCAHVAVYIVVDFSVSVCGSVTCIWAFVQTVSTDNAMHR